MPIFEYHCQPCNKTFEKLLKTPLDKFVCPVCGQQAKRVVSTPSAFGDAACSAPSGSGFQ